ncbi:MAG: sigma 54-interacting transcriptional regulator [SAR324 cluster bacterium]|nr:sigma 54-interacting transcriptional regulator [SAR324 cluster bacterium]
MQKILRELTILAQGMGHPVLLLGETGTGKTTLARQFHEMSGKPENSFQHVVCGEFRGADLNLVKSQLFGHVKGAFTGAETQKSGMLEEADGGTLFLDEIGDIPLEVQRLLIDAVESKRFRTLGSLDVQESDFQLICATNRDVEEMLQTNELSQDFHFRISSFRYIIPPLRERPEDVPVILADPQETEHYLKLEFEETAMDELIRRLQQSSLSGNVRDVQRILDHLVLQSQMPQSHALTQKEISNYFAENREPTQDEFFVDTVQELLQQWPQTSFAKRGEKWRDALLDVALKGLAERPEYKKKSGELNIHKLATILGVDHKTIKSRYPIS